MEFKYGTKESGIMAIIILVFALAILIYEAVLLIVFGTKIDIMPTFILTVAALAVCLFGHLDWHEEQDKKALEVKENEQKN
jgi:fatty acid desaturase